MRLMSDAVTGGDEVDRLVTLNRAVQVIPDDRQPMREPLLSP